MPRAGDMHQNDQERAARERDPRARRARMEAGRWFKLALLTLLLAACVEELLSSRLQSMLWTSVARDLHFSVSSEPGPVRAAPIGPYDARLGYSELPERVKRLESRGFRLSARAEWSPGLEAWTDRGFHPIYREKVSAGLTVQDRFGEPLYARSHPTRAFDRFEDVPRLIVDTLVFIENRELLSPDFPLRNPAIEWDRLAQAAFVRTIGTFSGRKGPGGSTLATQLEKYRHSEGGITHSVEDKLRQIVSASVRGYMGGPDTSDARRQIALHYINTVPLAARAGFGEIHGLGDGLWAWYGSDLGDVSYLLEDADADPRTRARVYKQSLSLFLAERRPSHYLIRGKDDLRALADRYLRLLADEGVIDGPLRDAALEVDLEFLDEPPPRPAHPWSERKAVDAVRNELLGLTGLSSLYDLDRLDLTVATSLDAELNASVTETLRQLRDPNAEITASLRGPRLLGHAPPEDVVYSFTLFESTPEANLLRVQVDTLDQPFNVNQGLKLDLGSTAKLRTMIHYLELVAELHAHYAGLPADELRAVRVHPADPIHRWVLARLVAHPEIKLEDLLETALDRSYSGRPASFFTGGGRHPFANFDRRDNGRMLTLRGSFRHSVNLPFVRLMRDVVHHQIYGPPNLAGDTFTNSASTRRRELLDRFVMHESAEFVRSFYSRHASLTPDERLQKLVTSGRRSWRRHAIVFRTLHPQADPARFAAFMRKTAPQLDDAKLEKLYAQYDPDRMGLNDRGVLARLHPLELWVAAHLDRSPGASLRETLKAGLEVRREAYDWLYRTRSLRAQDRRIRVVLEREAFARIHESWRSLGYPFGSLVPSLGTAIGASADRPEALAELVGILLNDGVRLSSRRIASLRFADDTPYETRLEREEPTGDFVLWPEIARVIRGLLVDVVEHGTARRARGAFDVEHEDPLQIGGKTGTGDNRRKVFSRSGRLVESTASSRTATFAFIIGDRHFGVLTAYVEGEGAADHRFTSSLPVQVLRLLAPDLRARISGFDGPGPIGPLEEGGVCSADVPRCVTPEAGPGTTAGSDWRNLRRFVTDWFGRDPAPAPAPALSGAPSEPQRRAGDDTSDWRGLRQLVRSVGVEPGTAPLARWAEQWLADTETDADPDALAHDTELERTPPTPVRGLVADDSDEDPMAVSWESDPAENQARGAR